MSVRWNTRHRECYSKNIWSLVCIMSVSISRVCDMLKPVSLLAGWFQNRTDNFYSQTHFPWSTRFVSDDTFTFHTSMSPWPWWKEESGLLLWSSVVATRTLLVSGPLSPPRKEPSTSGVLGRKGWCCLNDSGTRHLEGWSETAWVKMKGVGEFPRPSTLKEFNCSHA